MMLFTQTTFIGIDPTAGQRPFVYAALDSDLRLLALGEGDLDEVLLVAVCAPRRPNQGLMQRDEVRSRLSPRPRPGRWTNARVVEYLLRLHRIRCPHTRAQEADCPGWMRMGFQLFQRLQSLGYMPYPATDSPRQLLEVYPHACYTVLLERTPFPKHTLEGRLQRQLVLYARNVQISDPMRFFEEITRHRLLHGILPEDELYSPGELDALIAAYTAWLTVENSERVTALGDPAEGQIILPVPKLKDHY